MRAAVVLLLAASVLASCGKKGPPEQPGPPSEIMYPKAYPHPPTTP
jgi:predicted small lipoprotein YifL